MREFFRGNLNGFPSDWTNSELYLGKFLLDTWAYLLFQSVSRWETIRLFGVVKGNPHTPVAQRVADEVVFRRFQGEGVGFLKSNLTDTPSDFLCAI